MDNYKKLLEEFVTLGQRWTYNDLNKTAQSEYLHLFGKAKEAIQESQTCKYCKYFKVSEDWGNAGDCTNREMECLRGDMHIGDDFGCINFEK